MDENQQNTQNTDTSSPAPTTDSPTTEMPPVAPESPTNVVDTPPNKDDNQASISTESSIEEPVKTEEIPVSSIQTSVKSNNFSSGEQTAQMVGNEPIRTQGLIRGLLEKAKLAIQRRKRKKLDKIMNLFAKQTNINNNDVQKLLYVSDATATRYLNILKTEGKIKQNGKTGKGVLYTPVK